MARLQSNTTIYGTANVLGQLLVGTSTANNSGNITSGSLVVTGGAGISGNLYASFVYSNNQDVIVTSLMYSVAFG
jgi:hypothetical protein